MTEKVWFITGCATGFGAALAQHLAETGLQVAVTDRDRDSLNTLPQAPHVLKLQLDVTDVAQIHDAVAQTLAHFGRIDVLVNNAGMGWGGPFEEMSLELNRRLFEVNILGMMALTQVVVPHMRAQRGGHIINISSDSGIYGQPFSTAYCATKHAVEGFSESLSHELYPFNVRVTVIEPCGMFATAMPRDAVAMVEKMTSPESAYYPIISAMLPGVKANLANASSPSLVVDAILEVSALADPPMRKPVGTPDRTGIVEMRQQMPDEIFVKTMRAGMGIG